MRGDTLFVGASSEDSNASGIGGSVTNNASLGSGAVYMYKRQGTSWGANTYIKQDPNQQGANFGSRMALDGNTLLIGTSIDNFAVRRIAP